MSHHPPKQDPAGGAMPRRLFLRLGLLALAEAGGVPAYAMDDELATARFLLQWGKKGTEPGAFHFPIGIAISRANEVWVTDHYNNRVQCFDGAGKLLRHFPVQPNPGGIAIDSDGNLFLSHFGVSGLTRKRTADRVSVYTSAGTLVREWGKTGDGDGEFLFPGGVAVTADGRVYVADQTNRRVQVFNREGKFLFKWGAYGTGPGQFGGNVVRISRVGGPQFVALDSAGNVYTTEASVGRVQKFTAEGKSLLSWGDNAVKPGSFGSKFQKSTLQGPVAVTVDKQDRVWVSAVCGRIQQFTAAGKYLRGFGEEGTKPGQFIAPHGLALDSKGTLYVVDAYNHRIQKFAV